MKYYYESYKKIRSPIDVTSINVGDVIRASHQYTLHTVKCIDKDKDGEQYIVTVDPPIDGLSVYRDGSSPNGPGICEIIKVGSPPALEIIIPIVGDMAVLSNGQAGQIISIFSNMIHTAKKIEIVYMTISLKIPNENGFTISTKEFVANGRSRESNIRIIKLIRNNREIIYPE